MRFFNLTFNNNENTEIVDKFIDEYAQWHNTGKTPDMGSLDVNYTLELQKKRLDENNVRKEVVFDTKESSFKQALKCFTVTDRGDYKSDVACKDYKVTETFFVNNKKKKKRKNKRNFYATITRLLNQNAGGAVACPNCGAISDVQDLLTGCKSCGTRFIIDDLFPKVTNFYHIKDEADLIRKILKPSMLICVLGMIATVMSYSLISNINNGNIVQGSDDFVFQIVQCVIVGLIYGTVSGYILWAAFILIWMMIGAIKSLFLLGPHVRAKTQLPKVMRQIDPNFSYEFFIGKVINLMKLMIFSDDYTNLAAYDGKPMQNTFKDIVDISYDGTVRYNTLKTDGNYCYVDITVYTTVTKVDGGALKSSKEKFRVVVCKNIHAIANAGFSIKNVNCRSCGGSFDATREHNCPYCGTPYHLGNDDWVVVDFKRE